MNDILDDFINGLEDDGWPFEGIIGEEPTKRPSLPAITWTRQWLRKNGPHPAHEVLAAGKRAGYQEHVIEGTVGRNRQWFVTYGGMWSLRPTSVEWLSDYLIAAGETAASVVLAAGSEAGFKASTITAAKADVVGFFWRRVDGVLLWRVER